MDSKRPLGIVRLGRKDGIVSFPGMLDQVHVACTQLAKQIVLLPDLNRLQATYFGRIVRLAGLDSRPPSVAVFNRRKAAVHGDVQERCSFGDRRSKVGIFREVSR